MRKFMSDAQRAAWNIVNSGKIIHSNIPSISGMLESVAN